MLTTLKSSTRNSSELQHSPENVGTWSLLLRCFPGGVSIGKQLGIQLKLLEFELCKGICFEFSAVFFILTCSFQMFFHKKKKGRVLGGCSCRCVHRICLKAVFTDGDSYNQYTLPL